MAQSPFDPTNHDTAERVRAWRAHDPYITATEMASALGVSRQRIREILEAEGLPTRPPRRPPPVPPAGLLRPAKQRRKLLQ